MRNRKWLWGFAGLALGASASSVAFSIWFRRGLSEDNLQRAGATAVFDAVQWPGNPRTIEVESSLNRRERTKDGWTLYYKAHVYRRSLDWYPQPVSCSGALRVEVKVSVTERWIDDLNGRIRRPEWIGSPTWSRDDIQVEDLWSRVDEEPGNVLFDLSLAPADLPSSSRPVLTLAAHRRLGNWFLVYEELNCWREEDCDRAWAPRLNAELKAIQQALNSDVIPKEHRLGVKVRLKEFLSDPRFAKFQAAFRKNLALTNNT